MLGPVVIQPSRETLRRAFVDNPLHPVWAEMLCDTETPVGAYARLRSLYPNPFLLESVVGGERWARYSFLGLGHRVHVRGELREGALGFVVTPGPGFDLPSSLPTRLSDLEGLRRLLAEFRGPAM